MDLHLTAISRSKQLLIAECAIVNALVTGQAIVVAFMKTALYAKQVASAALRLAELNTGPEIDHCVIERSPQIFDACMLGLETLNVGLKPCLDMGNT